MSDKLIKRITQLTKEYFEKYNPTFEDDLLNETNAEAYRSTINAFARYNKIILERATGTGKSFIVIKFLKDHARGKGLKVLHVCPSVAIRDDFVEYSKEYLGLDKNEIDINFVLYHSLHNVVNEKYDIIILDEVHRAGAKTWSVSVEQLLKNNPKAKVLGLTATLERVDGVDVTRLFDRRQPVSTLTLADALNKKYLPNPNYLLAKIDFDEDFDYIQDKISNFNEELKTATDEEKKEIKELIEQLKLARKKLSFRSEIPDIFAKELNTEELKNAKIIVFCPPGYNDDGTSNPAPKMEEIMKQAATWFSKVDGLQGIRQYALHSRFSEEDNNNALKSFENDNAPGLKILYNIDKLKEGKHVKGANVLIMLRSTSSKGVFLQQLGRVLSVGAQKPKVFDFVANLNYIDIENVRNLFMQVKPYRSITSVPGKIEDVDKPEVETKDFNFSIENLEALQFLDVLKQKIHQREDRFSYNFSNLYSRFLQYKQEFGNLKIPQKYVCIDGFDLGMKAKFIRQGSISITAQEKELLDEIGFEWSLSRIFDFDIFLAKLLEYQESFGDLKVKHTYVCKDGYALGRKAKDIRIGALKITDEERAVLDNVGFIWDMSREMDFELFVSRLLEYKEKFGDLLVPRVYVCEDGYTLGSRVKQIRSGRTKTTDEQKAELNSIGFVWNAKKSFDFDELYQKLLEYKEINGDLNIKCNYVCDDGYKLGEKIKAIRNGNIVTNEDQKTKLDSIGFIWRLISRKNIDVNID